MTEGEAGRTRRRLIWAALSVALILPVALSAASPLLAWREPIYIGAGFAGVVGLACIAVQPLLVGGFLPLHPVKGRRLHRWIGIALVASILLHVGGLWVTSPPDVIDALTFTSPTPFSDWGVIAMWATFGAAALALLRRRLGLGQGAWRVGHTVLAAIVVGGTVAHAVLIDGTMETVSKIMLCALAIVAASAAILRLRVWHR